MEMGNESSDKRYPCLDACLRKHCLHCASSRPCPPLIVIATHGTLRVAEPPRVDPRSLQRKDGRSL
jgi:hypothetical protein